MHHYKLIYFDIRGRGEAIRLLFHLAGEKFEDARVSMEGWASIKNSMPLGQLPVLEIDGTKIAQSQAILRYLGHQFRRAGANPVDCAKLDMIGECIHDFMAEPAIVKYAGVLLGMVQADKNQYFKEHVVPELEKHAPIIEKFLLENGNNGLFLGDRETWVDVFGADAFVKMIDFGSPDALDAYPHILALINRVFNTPSIKTYVSTRKPTPF